MTKERLVIFFPHSVSSQYVCQVCLSIQATLPGPFSNITLLDSGMTDCENEFSLVVVFFVPTQSLSDGSCHIHAGSPPGIKPHRAVERHSY